MVLVSHSMGGALALFFMKWVESPVGGNGGPRWVEQHIHAFVNIAGPLLGAPKTAAALISGEVRDSAQLGAVGAFALEQFFSRSDRLKLMRSWAGGAAMLLKGSPPVVYCAAIID